MLRGIWLLALASFALSGCEQNLLAHVPDAPGPDARHVDGDFTCVDTPWPTTAPDPLTVAGQLIAPTGAGINGVSVEVHAVAGDALLAQTTTQGSIPSAGGTGRYSVGIATGGTAPTIYRKYTPSGYLTHYEYDPMPAFDSNASYGNIVQSQSGTEQYDSLVDLPPDPAKGNLIVTISDCGLEANERGVAGATIDAPPGARVIYVNTMRQPDPSLTETAIVDGVAPAVVLNLPPGPADITIHAGDVTYRSWRVQIHANAWTISHRKP